MIAAVFILVQLKRLLVKWSNMEIIKMQNQSSLILVSQSKQCLQVLFIYQDRASVTIDRKLTGSLPEIDRKFARKEALIKRLLKQLMKVKIKRPDRDSNSGSPHY